jgi:hypothetical protein
VTSAREHRSKGESATIDIGMKRPRIVAFQVSERIGVRVIAACAIAAFITVQCAAQQPLDPVLTANQNQAASNAKKKQAKHKQQAAPDEPVPSLEIPAAPLGFAPPAMFYLTERFSQATLHFLSENKLLFTFRVPGLIARSTPAPGEMRTESRHIRAVVLDLPSGTVTAEALWELHDYSPYLWSLDDGKFLLRDRNLLKVGDASLHLEPFLRFPGDVTFVELDPDNKFLIANTNELSAAAKKEDQPSTAAASIVGSDRSKAQGETGHGAGPASGSASGSSSSGGSGQAGDKTANDKTPDPDHPSSDSSAEPRQTEQSLLRILSMDTREVLLFSRVNGVAHLPIDGAGYYEALRGNGLNWEINYQNFHGGSQPVGSVLSVCYPVLEVLAPKTVLASSCAVAGGRRLSLLRRDEAQGSSNAKALSNGLDKAASSAWDALIPDTQVWPQVARAPHGRRFAFSTLHVVHPIGPSTPLDRDDIRNQWIDVFDEATGKVVLSVTASPILDAGGNFALSPSGERFAVLHEGAIQIFDMPPAPAMPGPLANAPVAAKP